MNAQHQMVDVNILVRITTAAIIAYVMTDTCLEQTNIVVKVITNNWDLVNSSTCYTLYRYWWMLWFWWRMSAQLYQYKWQLLLLMCCWLFSWCQWSQLLMWDVAIASTAEPLLLYLDLCVKAKLCSPQLLESKPWVYLYWLIPLCLS